ncbi:hypothetical protein Tco_0913468 [Tanacetum coccineum]
MAPCSIGRICRGGFVVLKTTGFSVWDYHGFGLGDKRTRKRHQAASVDTRYFSPEYYRIAHDMERGCWGAIGRLGDGGKLSLPGAPGELRYQGREGGLAFVFGCAYVVWFGVRFSDVLYLVCFYYVSYVGLSKKAAGWARVISLWYCIRAGRGGMAGLEDLGLAVLFYVYPFLTIRRGLVPRMITVG